VDPYLIFAVVLCVSLGVTVMVFDHSCLSLYWIF